MHSLGLDSISTVELRNQIYEATGVELDNAMILANPSIGEIVDAVSEQVQSTSGQLAKSSRQMEISVSAKKDVYFEDLTSDPTAHRCVSAIAPVVLFILSTARAGSSLL